MPVLVNGEFQSVLSTADRGLAYGDGLFETIAVHEGRAPLLDFHLDRLTRSCQRLALQSPALDLLDEELNRLAARDSCVVKITITRGENERGYRIPSEPKPPTRIMQRFELPKYPQSYQTEGVHVRLCDYRLPINPVLAGIKHLNRLDQVMARSEWEDEYQEGVMLDTQDRVVEGTMSNLFICKELTVSTPSLTYAGVNGVMREYILQYFKQQGIECEVRPMGLDDLKNADSMFLCNSVIGVWPICEFAGVKYSVTPLVKQVQAIVSAILGQQAV